MIQRAVSMRLTFVLSYHNPLGKGDGYWGIKRPFGRAVPIDASEALGGDRITRIT